MLQAMILVQWARVRTAVILVAVGVLAVPLSMVSAGGGSVGMGAQVSFWLRQSAQLGYFLPIAMLFVGAYLGVQAWVDDQRGGHVYALSLPLARERFVAMRFVAGGLPLLVPALSLLAGSLAATAAVELPPGIHAYPVPLFLRALLALVTCYAVFFAVAVATKRAALIVLGTLAGLVISELVLVAAGVDSGGVLDNIGGWLTRWPGPFEVLTGRWALFDV